VRLHTIRHYGIDTSVLLRLVTRLPEPDFRRTKAALDKRAESEPFARFVVSNQVVGEAYLALQHHYGYSKADARHDLMIVLSQTGLEPLGGEATLEALQTTRGCGLVDRLIVLDYQENAAVTLTNDKRMAKLTGVQLLA